MPYETLRHDRRMPHPMPSAQMQAIITIDIDSDINSDI
jgi:hypothetical protein